MEEKGRMIKETRKYLGLLDDEESLAALPDEALNELYLAVKKAGRYIWGMGSHAEDN